MMSYSNPQRTRSGHIVLNAEIGHVAVLPHDDLYRRAEEGEFGAVAPAPEPDPNEAIEQERAGMVCTRAQGKHAIGPEMWAKVVALAEAPETPWGLKVAVFDTYEWRRTSPDMDALIWAMELTPEQADDLFRLAMTL